MISPSERCVWQLDGAVFDEHRLELRVNDQLVHLERRQIRLLSQLLRNAGTVVTKQELLHTAWPQRVISDSALTSTIAKLRRLLGPSLALQLKTVHGYGYCWQGPVRQLANPLPRATAPTPEPEPAPAPPALLPALRHLILRRRGWLGFVCGLLLGGGAIGLLVWLL